MKEYEPQKTQAELFQDLEKQSLNMFSSMRGMKISELNRMPDDKREEYAMKLNEVILTAKMALKKLIR